MRKITTATVLLVVLLMGCSSEESVASTVDVEGTVDARVATAIASQPIPTAVEVIVTATATPTAETSQPTFTEEEVIQIVQAYVRLMSYTVTVIDSDEKGNPKVIKNLKSCETLTSSGRKWEATYNPELGKWELSVPVGLYVRLKIYPISYTFDERTGVVESQNEYC